MSMITFGPPVYVDGPLPKPPPRSLLTTPGVLQEEGDDRWMNGVAVWGYPEGEPFTWDPCSTGTFETKSDESTFSTPDFAAFVIYLPVTCSSFTVASDPEGFAQRAEIALDAIKSFAIERALSQGVTLSTNPFLSDANVTFPGGTAALSPYVGLAYLEDAIGDTARGGMIHATPSVASTWFTSFPVFQQDVGSTLYTPNGTPVVAGGGYKGATPFGQAPAAAGQSWVYATGPVQAWVARETTLNIKDVLDRDDNTVTFRAERYALVEWDTALQAAVLIDWTP
jgi:hypothetical protein